MREGGIPWEYPWGFQAVRWCLQKLAFVALKVMRITVYIYIYTHYCKSVLQMLSLPNAIIVITCVE